MALRILHVTTIDLTAHCFLRDTFDFLRQQGHEVALACTFERFREDLRSHCDHLFPVQIARQISPWKDLLAVGQLRKVLGRYRPHIIHTHTSKAGFVGRLAGYLAGAPLRVHTIHELPQNSTTSPLKRAFYRMLEKGAAHWCHQLVTVSHVNERQILGEGICPSQKLTYIPNGLRLERYRPTQARESIRSAWGIPRGARLMGMAGRLEPAKGHHDLVEAFALLARDYPDLHLVMMGQGHLHSQIEAHIQALGLRGRAHLVGWVEDLISSLAALDLFVLSSHYEGFGVVLAEALALQLPCVSTRVGGTQDIMEDGVHGLFANPRDPASLAGAARRLLDDPLWAAQLAQEGYRKVTTEYRCEVVNPRLLQLYEASFPKSQPSRL